VGSAKYKVVVTDSEFPHLEREKKILKEEADAELVYKECKTEDDIVELARDADGILNLYFGPVGRKTFEAAKNLKVVVRYGIGLDTIDIKAATEYGIAVGHVPDYCLDEVSDHTLALILNCARKITLLNNTVKGGKWDFKVSKPVYRIKGKTLGIVGFGKIGRMVAAKAKAFGLNLLVYDPFISEDIARDYSATMVEKDKLFSEADFIALHLPLNEATRHFIGEKELKAMKKNTYLINAARGGVIDTEALYKALKEGWIAGAAIDLVEGSPEEWDHLFRLENLTVTPHAAWYSEESITQLQETAAREVARVLNGRWPVNFVNPEVKTVATEKRGGSK